jgi:hypothetical protein
MAIIPFVLAVDDQSIESDEFETLLVVVFA